MCDMCGKEKENLYKAEIEGTKLNVCGECAKYGNIISAPKRQEPKIKKQVIIRKSEPEIPEKRLIYMVSPDFASKVRNKREKLGLKQKEFAKKISEKESVVHKLETGEFTPSLKLARKLEIILEIQLIESYEEEEKQEIKKEAKDFTIGDMLTIKKKKT